MSSVIRKSLITLSKCKQSFPKLDGVAPIDNITSSNSWLYGVLEDTARYAGVLLAPAEGFGLRTSLFFAFFRAKKEVIMLFWPFFGNFWCPVVTLVTFSSYISNFERNPKKTKKIQKIQINSKNFKKSKNAKKSKKLKKKSEKKKKNP